MPGCVFLFFIWAGICQHYHVDGLNCNGCQNVESPEHCRDLIVCGIDEICFTREYTDSQQRQAFHLGCEEKSRCSLFKNPLLGKRDSSKKCFDCCSTDNCNSALCLDNLDIQITNKQNTSCPRHFEKFQNNCYLFAPGTATWTVARDYCRSLGASMLSIMSKSEHDFLESELIEMKASHIGNFWTAGFYSHAAEEFEWLDGSHFNYSHWYPNQPPDSFNHSVDYYVVLGNPAYSSTYYRGAPIWVNEGGQEAYGISCKTSIS